eukprot:Opistho-2@74678
MFRAHAARLGAAASLPMTAGAGVAIVRHSWGAALASKVAASRVDEKSIRDNRLATQPLMSASEEMENELLRKRTVIELKRKHREVKFAVRKLASGGTLRQIALNALETGSFVRVADSSDTKTIPPHVLSQDASIGRTEPLSHVPAPVSSGDAQTDQFRRFLERADVDVLTIPMGLRAQLDKLPSTSGHPTHYRNIARDLSAGASHTVQAPLHRDHVGAGPRPRQGDQRTQPAAPEESVWRQTGPSHAEAQDTWATQIAVDPGSGARSSVSASASSPVAVDLIGTVESAAADAPVSRPVVALKVAVTSDGRPHGTGHPPSNVRNASMKPPRDAVPQAPKPATATPVESFPSEPSSGRHAPLRRELAAPPTLNQPALVSAGRPAALESAPPSNVASSVPSASVTTASSSTAPPSPMAGNVVPLLENFSDERSAASSYPLLAPQPSSSPPPVDVQHSQWLDESEPYSERKRNARMAIPPLPPLLQTPELPSSADARDARTPQSGVVMTDKVRLELAEMARLASTGSTYAAPSNRRPINALRHEGTVERSDNHVHETYIPSQGLGRIKEYPRLLRALRRVFSQPAVNPRHITLAIKNCWSVQIPYKRKLSLALRVKIACSRRGIPLNNIHYNALVRLFLYEDAARKELLDEMHAAGYQRDVFTYAAQMHLLVSRGDINAAWSVIDEMRAAGVEPDQKMFRILMRIRGRNQSQHVLACVENLRAMGVSLSVASYSLALQVCYEQRNLSIAEIVWGRMMEDGVEPNVITYTTLVALQGLCGSVERAQEIVTEMETAGSVKPNVITYTILMKAYVNHDDAARVRWLLDHMQAVGCPPNEFTYQEALRLYMRSGNVGAITDTVAEMRRQGVAVTAHVYTTLLSIYASQGNVEASLGVIAEMAHRGVKPDTLVYTKLIRLYEAARRPDGILTTLSAMHDGGLIADERLYGRAMRVLAAEGMFAAMTSVAAAAVERGVQITKESWVESIDLMTTNGHMETAKEAIAYVATLYNPADMGHFMFLDLIYFAEKAKDFDLTLRLYKSAVGAGLHLGNLLVKIARRHPNNVDWLSPERTDGANLPPDVTLFNARIAAHVAACDVRSAMATYLQMIQANIHPNASTEPILVSAMMLDPQVDWTRVLLDKSCPARAERSTYNSLLSFYVQLRRPHRGVPVLQQLLDSGIGLNGHTVVAAGHILQQISHALGTLHAQGRVREALELYEKHYDKGARERRAMSLREDILGSRSVNWTAMHEQASLSPLAYEITVDGRLVERSEGLRRDWPGSSERLPIEQRARTPNNMIAFMPPPSRFLVLDALGGAVGQSRRADVDWNAQRDVWAKIDRKTQEEMRLRTERALQRAVKLRHERSVTEMLRAERHAKEASMQSKADTHTRPAGSGAGAQQPGQPSGAKHRGGARDPQRR